MEKLQNYFNTFGFMVGFLILCIFVEMLLGRETLTKFLWLVLFGMVITNANEFIQFLKGTGKSDTSLTSDPESLEKYTDGFIKTKAVETQL